MFKGHPKGLFVAFFANMGERFGFYTMISIFVLFMQAKYGMSAAAAGSMYATFLVGVYAFPLLGGFLADRFLGYGRTINLGIIVMFIGYALLALPTMMNTGFPLVVVALTVIALGTGLFKGNLQAVVGSLYDDPKYAPTRDRAFNIFYMGINIGAMFAPSASMAVCNWILGSSHFVYDARIPALANDLLNGKVADASSFLTIAQGQDPSVTMGTLGRFATDYVNALSKSYHLGFGVACLSLIFSMIVFWAFRKHYKTAALTERQKARSEALKSQVVELTREQTRERLVALGLVFFVVIFFWMAFHQSAVTLTYFARDYTVPSVASDQPLVRPDRAPVHLPVRARPRLPCEESLEQPGPHSRRDLLCRLRRPGLPPLQRLRRDESFPAPDVPALQPVLHRRPDAHRRRHLRQPQPERQGAVGAAQDRHRHADDSCGLCHPDRRLARPGEPA
jgi:POT family proton-dependent oligopeptide transporter